MNTDQLRNILQPMVTYGTTASAILSNLDANQTGIDDETAKKITEVTGVIQSFLASLPVVNIAQGYAAIKAFCDSVLSSMDLIIASDISQQEKYDNCRVLFESLSDESKVYPARKGKDGEYLAASKAKASVKLAGIITK